MTTRKEKQAASDLSLFLTRVVEELNRTVPTDNEVANCKHEQWKVARSEQDRLTRQLIEDGASDDQMQMRRKWSELERDRYGELFRGVAKRERLPNAVLDELREDALATMRWETNAELDPVLKFHDAKSKGITALRGKMAYVLVRLASGKADQLRVVQCKHCRILVVVPPGSRGRPRSEFCSPAHSNAYAQAQARLRKRETKKVASKRK